jgi:hypothetical protein
MTQLRRLGRILAGILLELADESAYRRHLLAEGRAASPEEWRRFLDHRLRAKFTRPKCC